MTDLLDRSSLDPREAERRLYADRIAARGSDPPPRPRLRLQMIGRAKEALHRDGEALPGHGLYIEHRVAMAGIYVLLAACGMAWHLGRRSTADALRRLADRIEEEGPAALERGLE